MTKAIMMTMRAILHKLYTITMMTTMMMMMMMMMRSLWPTKLDSTIQIPLSPSSHVKND